MAPALQLSRPDLVSGLKDGVAAGTVPRSRLRRLLVAFQVALSLMLVVGTGLLVRTLQSRWAEVPALAPERVLQVWLEPALEGLDPVRANAFYARLAERAAALPGVDAVALSRQATPWDRSFFQERVVTQGREGLDSVPDASYDVVSPGYFRTMGRALAGGRDFTDQDREGAPHVVIVNETLARRFWPGESPLGRRLRLWQDDEREVVGVAAGRAWREAPGPFIYLPLAQRNPWPQSPMILHLRAAGNPEDLVPVLRREVSALEPDLPVFRTATLAQSLRGDLVEAQLVSLVLGSAGLLALVLSAVGLYGVMSYGVSQRWREFGVRVALGASRADVVGLVVGEGMAVTAWGLAAGALGAWLVTPLIVRISFGAGVAAVDPLGMATAMVVLALVGLLACAVPARRAVNVDPAVALRNE